MTRHPLRWLAMVTLTLAVGLVPMAAWAGATSDSLLELAGERGPSLGFGVGVSPFRWELLAPPLSGAKAAESSVLADPELRGHAVSFDIKLRWPGAESTMPLEPYLIFGPVLFVDQPQDAFSLSGIPADRVMRVGAKAGVGINWRLSRDATLFGSYDVTTSGTGAATAPGARAPAASGIDGYDLLYGVRFRY
jgi:hypothetical protein